MVETADRFRLWIIPRAGLRRRIERGDERHAGESTWPRPDFLQHRRGDRPPVRGDPNVRPDAGDQEMESAGRADSGDGKDRERGIGTDLDWRDLFFDSGN